MCYNIENVKEQHQGEAESHDVYVCMCVCGLLVGGQVADQGGRT